MSEPTTEAPAATQAEGQETKSDQSFTQADVDRIVADRLKRERDKIGDVKALRAAADELAAIKESQKTEAQKYADRLAATESELAAARRDALRSRIAAKYRISEQDTNLFLTGTDEESLVEQAQRLAEHAAAVTANGVQGFGIDTSGRQANPPPNKDSAARAVFGI